MALPSRTLGGGGFVNRFAAGGDARARSARAPPGGDGLKINYVQMQNGITHEFLVKCWFALKASDRLPLTEAEQRFYTAIHLAVMAYEDEVRLGHPATEQRCMICHASVSKCCC